MNIKSLRQLSDLRSPMRILAGMYVGWVLLFVMAKIVFMLCYPSLYGGCGLADYLNVILHGLRLDMATAGYLTALPALFLVGSAWIRSVKGVALPLKIYLGMMIPIVVLIIMVDTTLYIYWDFKLDITPLFYFLSSPGAAMASTSAVTIVFSVIAWVAVSAGAWWLMAAICGLSRYRVVTRCRAAVSGAMLLMAALLFIPIRGGFGVATINLSSAYFSQNMRLNHAAINPAFSLLYSAMHQQRFGDQFRFLPEGDAAAIMARIRDGAPSEGADSLLSTRRPDVYIILMESFSTHLVPSLGGEPIATRLDSIAAGGLMFTRMYASSFRTDRAAAAILNAFPSQPNTSVMKFPEKTRHLPSLARSLGGEGYTSTYYYGGDDSFANKRSYLINTGFNRIVSQDDFPRSYRAAKWGVPDEYIFDRVLADVAAADTVADARRLSVIMTLSSHEPFDVPYVDPNPDFAGRPAVNAFRYADKCLGDFVDSLSHTPAWERSIVVIVPDHYGCYPQIHDPMDVEARHHIPVVMTGGALARRGTVDAVASQTDLAATLLDAMGIDRSDFTFSRNILGDSTLHIAYTSTPSYIALTDSTGLVSLYNIENKAWVTTDGTTPADSLLQGLVQTLYDTLQQL